MRYFLEIAYRGTAYHGWQKQAQSTTVQGLLEGALAKILRHTVETMGSGRTDTGVHASQQFVHFDTENPIQAAKLIHQLNGILPADIAIKQVYAAGDNTHARFDALSRAYIYNIIPQKNPFLTDQAWCCPFPYDMVALNQAADVVRSQTDFTSFSKVQTAVDNFQCTIFHSYWEEADGVLRYHIKANRFLRGMVRALVGTQWDLSQGKLTLTQFQDIFTAQDRRQAGQAAPAAGLFLSEVTYPEGVLQRLE